MWFQHQESLGDEPMGSLAEDILRLADVAENHIGYIQRALDTAKDYAHSMRNGTSSADLIQEGYSHFYNAGRLDDLLADANEAALELRRAGDTPLNNHYG